MPKCLPCDNDPRGRLTLAFVKASPEAQLRLLELADLDTELSRLDHRRRTLPEIAELSQLDERAAKVRDAITIADTNLVRPGPRARPRGARRRTGPGPHRQGQRAAQRGPGVERPRARVAAVGGHLAPPSPVRPRRGRARADGAARGGAGAARRRGRGGGDRGGRYRGRGRAPRRGPRRDRRAVERRRRRRGSRVVAGIPDDLLALYDKVRAQSAGLGAAPLRRGQCGGCRVLLSTVALNEIRAAAADEVHPLRGVPEDSRQDRRLRSVKG